jgi:signal transduction histidine kinase
LSQRLPWFAAAVLVVIASVFVALWLDSTAGKVDQGTLDRGADAVTANVEEQIRILELAGTGTQSLVGQSLEELDLAQMVAQIDTSVLTALMGIVKYPINATGATDGEFIELGLAPLGFAVPRIAASREEIVELVESGDAFLSAPLATTDPDRLDYVVAVPVETEAGLELVGVVFRLDRILQSALEGAGEDQYVARVEDKRLDNRVVASSGEPTGDLEAQRSPDGVKDQLALIVAPGPEFPVSQSAWVPALVVMTGLAIALLLIWMGRMAQARAADLAERLRLAHELNESKDRFLATVSHELRTPLTVVLGAAAEAGARWETLDPDHRQELLGMMSEQAHEASHIVEDLLVAARSDPAKLRLAVETTELASHVEYALASLPKDSLPRIRWDRSPQTVQADSTRLRQILRNLLENAVKYGGPNIGIRSFQADGFAHIEVSDDGPGVAVADLERIFEPYEQSTDASPESPTGIGIGLYVSRLLARLMGGDLDCIRRGGETHFRLIIPVGNTTAASERRAVRSAGKMSAAS